MEKKIINMERFFYQLELLFFSLSQHESFLPIIGLKINPLAMCYNWTLWWPEEIKTQTDNSPLDNR